MSIKHAALAVTALALTAGAAVAAQVHHGLLTRTAATVPSVCTTEYATGTGADGRPVSLVNLTCSRSATRSAAGAAL